MPTGIARRGIGSRAGIGRKQIAARYALTTAQEPFTFGPGSYTFTPPKAGYWKVVLWGGGFSGEAANGGASGSYLEKTLYLTPNTPLALVIGEAAAASTATPAGGVTMTAGAASSSNTAGTASGGDVNLSGSQGATSGTGNPGLGTGGGAGGSNPGGAGAPANLPYRGGKGGDSGSSLPVPGATMAGRTPGGGGGYDSAVPAGAPGGHGLGIVVFIKD